MNKVKKWPLIGNNNVVDFLSKSIKNDKIAGSYIFVGNKNLGKEELIKFFIQTLFCKFRENDNVDEKILPCGKCELCRRIENIDSLNELPSVNSDCYLIEKREDKKNVKVSQVRELISQLDKSSFLNSYKIGIVKDAEKLSDNAHNAFLKTLEEPRKDVVIIMIATSISNIPATVISRSQVIKFSPVRTSTIYDFLIREYNVNKEDAMDMASISLGSPVLALKFFKQKDFYENYLKIVSVFIDFFGQDINSRFACISELISNKTVKQNLVKEVSSIINIWRGVLRDLLLLNINEGNLIKNKKILSQMNLIKIDKKSILKLLEDLDEAEEQIRGNVGPEFVLNNIALKVMSPNLVFGDKPLKI